MAMRGCSDDLQHRLRFISKKACSIQILGLTSLFCCIALLVLPLITNVSLPYSPCPWTSFSADHPPPPSEHPADMVFYPTYTSPKMQKAVDKLKKELSVKSLLRRGIERDKRVGKIEASLVRARALIKDAIIKSHHSPPPVLAQELDYVPQGEIYRNPYVFQRSYMLMEKIFKIYVYEEGDLPMFHNGPSKDIYSTEGMFLGFLESKSHVRTYDPDEAHLYFLPFSVVMIVETLFDPVELDKGVLERVVSDYIGIISTKYPYWNTTLGADHFMLSCHDWGPRATWYVHHLYFTSIRVLCNANTSEYFNPRKDVSFPEINLKSGSLKGLTTPGSPNRTILAFFAGKPHGKIRPLMFKYWENKDEDIKVMEKVASYKEMMEMSKYCLCPSGWEVASPRVVEAIYAECVPVLISQDYVLPYSDVLDWDKFSVRVSVVDLPDLKRILMRIGDDEYEALRRRLRQAQRHFVVNDPPKRYDVFNMMIHSLWLRRLNLKIN